MMDFSWSLSMMVFQSAPCNLKIRRIVFHLQDLFNYPVANNPLFWKNEFIFLQCWHIFWVSMSNFVRFSFRFRKCQNKKECTLSRNLPTFFDQVGHQTTNASIGNKYFLLNNVIIRLTQILNRADKNWAHFW